MVLVGLLLLVVSRSGGLPVVRSIQKKRGAQSLGVAEGAGVRKSKGGDGEIHDERRFYTGCVQLCTTHLFFFSAVFFCCCWVLCLLIGRPNKAVFQLGRLQRS